VFGAASFKIPNRKRIAMVMDTRTDIQEDKAEIFFYILEYGNVPFNAKKFEIGTEEQLKQVLFGIEQRFYTAWLGTKKRMANLIINMTMVLLLPKCNREASYVL
jgi:hypothetical protein